MPPARPPNPPGKKRSLHLTNSAQRPQERDYRHCARNTPRMRYPHFFPPFVVVGTPNGTPWAAVHPPFLLGQEKNPCSTEGRFPQPSCADQSRHGHQTGPKFDHLTEDHRLFLQKEKEEAHRAVHTSLGHSNAWRLCANAHCPKDPIKANLFPTKVCPTPLALCLSPLGHKPLQTCSTTGLEPIVSLDTDSPCTSKLGPVPQLGLCGALPTVPVAFHVFPKCCPCVLGDRMVEYTFIQKRFHPLTLSPKHDFIQ